jgi:hypothetical protein
MIQAVAVTVAGTRIRPGSVRRTGGRNFTLRLASENSHTLMYYRDYYY